MVNSSAHGEALKPSFFSFSHLLNRGQQVGDRINQVGTLIGTADRTSVHLMYTKIARLFTFLRRDLLTGSLPDDNDAAYGHDIRRQTPDDASLASLASLGHAYTAYRITNTVMTG